MGKTYLSPAKINWFLHVVGRREDGYHLLESVFQRIDWYDEIRISTRTDGRIELHGDLCGVTQEKNLAYRAALALKVAAEHAGNNVAELGAQIHLRKHIPTGAGLGGGSSNAATVLLALNGLWALGFDAQTLQRIGVTLGADVPFFVSECPAAFVQGIGEQLQRVNLSARAVLLVNPNVHINTGAVFTDATLPRQHAPINASLDDLQTMLDNSPIHAHHTNDLQTVTFKISDEVKAVYDALSPLAPTRMSGSGATMMACPSDDAQRAALEKWTASCPAHWQFRWVNTLDS